MPLGALLSRDVTTDIRTAYPVHMHDESKVTIVHVEILGSGGPNAIEMTIHEPLPRIPSWIRLQTFGDRPQFRTLPPGHFLERTEGRYGSPRDMVATARRYLAGDIDRAVAESHFAHALAEWSRATT